MSLIITPAVILSTLIAPDMFGGNSLFHVDDMNPQFVYSAENFGLSNIRWPGGSIAEHWFDPANPDVPLATPRTVGMGLDHSRFLSFTEIMTWASETRKGIDLVIPTVHVIRSYKSTGRANPADLTAIRSFVKEALQAGGKYPDARIVSFEVGNEYWGEFTPKEYGKAANDIIKQIALGIGDAKPAVRPKILVQVGDGWGPAFKEGGEHYGKGLTWGQILDTANRDIIGQLDGASRSLVDGVIDHVYSVSRGKAIVDDESHLVRRKADMWGKNGIRNELHVTEWNVKAKNQSVPITGLAMAPGVIRTFETLARSKTAAAYVWPVNHSTSTDLAGFADAGPGHMSANGAAFKLLSENVRGLSFSETTHDRGFAIEDSLYRNSTASVLFVSPVDGGPLVDSIPLTQIAPAAGPAGTHLVLSQSRIVRNAADDAFVGKGSGAAIIAEEPVLVKDLASFGELPISLAPYEVSMIKLSWELPKTLTVDSPNFRGTNLPEKIIGTEAAEAVEALDGDDQVETNGGDDRVQGGEGNDIIYGGAGADYAEGQNGDDQVYGGLDPDEVYGGAGNDSLHGDEGADTLFGGAGDDIMHGGDGDDVLVDGNGNDTLYGGAGNDQMFFGTQSGMRSSGHGIDSVYGGPGADKFVFGGVSGWTGILDFVPGEDSISFPRITSATGLKMFEKSENGRIFVRIEYLDDKGSGTIKLANETRDVRVKSLSPTLRLAK